MIRTLLPIALAVILAGSADAQPNDVTPDGAVGLAQALNGETGTAPKLSNALVGETGTTAARFGRISRTARTLVFDGSLSPEDFERAFARAGRKVNESEMAELGTLLSGKLPSPSTTTFAVPEATRKRAIELVISAGLSDEGKASLAAGKTFGASDLPQSVREVLAVARLNGARAYDVSETKSNGDLIFTHYPSITPATENMAFSYTEITPASLAADIADIRSQLRISGTTDIEGTSVGTYSVSQGGTGSVSSAYDEAYHPVRASSHSAWRGVLIQMKQDWIADQFNIDDLRKTRSRSNDRWSSNCAILADGTVHCLPAVRRHSASAGLILTNPALARSRRLLWNGHIRISKGKVTYIGTSGGISKLAARGKYRFINPIPLLKAWGFEMSPNLEVRSEHSSARYKADEKRAILHD
jgi:hypothetical protein